MDVEHCDPDLVRLEEEASFTLRLARGVVKAFRKRMQILRSAPDERDFYAMKSWHFERLKGDRSHQCSIRLNRQYRLIIEFKETEGGRVVQVIGIEDYH